MFYLCSHSLLSEYVEKVYVYCALRNNEQDCGNCLDIEIRRHMFRFLGLRFHLFIYKMRILTNKQN